VDVDGPFVGRDAAPVEDDLAAFDPADMPHADHVLDLAKEAQFGLADDGAAEHRGRDARIFARLESEGVFVRIGRGRWRRASRAGSSVERQDRRFRPARSDDGENQQGRGWATAAAAQRAMKKGPAAGKAFARHFPHP